MSEAVDLSKYFWWHSIRLDDGRVTPGWKTLELMTEEFGRTFGPLDLRGMTVLDVGAWNGGFTIEAKRRGATRVAALDHFTWNHPKFKGREGFDLATKLCNVEAEAFDIDLDTPRLSLESLKRFDVVLFLGVFYHLVDPIAALREVAGRAGKVLVLETFLEVTEDPRPSMVFYPTNELNDDATNWWGPNQACVEALLRLNGFGRIEVSAALSDAKFMRGVFHAYRE